jgi:hypothetical protein
MDGTYRPPVSVVGVRDARVQGVLHMIHIATSEMKFVAWDALNHALLVGVGATALNGISTKDELSEVLEYSSSFVSDFKYLPTFLIGFMVSAEASRWMATFHLALGVQGRCHDLGLFLSCAFGNSSPGTRATHFKFFRYINAAHYLLYFRHDDRIASDPDRVCKDLVVAGLFTPQEAEALAAAHPKMRDCLLGWIGSLFTKEVREGRIPTWLCTKFLEELAHLRGKMAALADSYDLYPTNTHTSMLGVTIRILIWALMVQYTSQAHDSTSCVHYASVVMSFCIICCYLGMLKLMNILAASPFDHRSKEPVNIDALLCSTETFLYTVLRSDYTDSSGQDL